MRRHRSAVGFREDGPFVGAALDIGRNLLASTKLGSLSRKNLSHLEDVTLVEEVLRPSCKKAGKKGKDLQREQLEGAALREALRRLLHSGKSQPRKPRAPGKPA
ncbi:hypothetical protein H8E07_00585, partial [bacterium]|nr:hypothetical protein [bacterium]